MANGITRRISTVMAVEGESEYRQSIKNINEDLSGLSTQLKLVESEYANQQNTMEALQAKSQVLADQQAKLAEKVRTCKEAYENAQAALTTYQTKTESLKAALAENQTALSALSTETRTAGTQWANYQSQVTAAETRLDQLRSTTGDTSEEEERLQKVIAQAKAAMAQLESETGGAAKTAGELLTEQKNLTTELEKSEAGTTAAASACKSWEKQQNSAQIQLNKTNADIQLNERYMEEAANSTDGCATSIDEYGNKVKSADTNTSSMKDSLKNLQNLMVTQVLTNAFKKLASALESCIDAASEFESQMSTVQALSGATSEEMEQLSAVAKEMGATTSFTATEAGEALEYMALAGWSTSEMLDGLSGVMTLAAAAGEDLSTVSDIVTDALTAFGYSASDSAHFADVLAAAASNSNTTVSQMGEAFQQVGTTAGTLGYTIDDVSVALGLMADSGIKGSSAGTALATALTRMSGANETAAAEMDKLGISMYNADGTAKDLNTFLSELRDTFQNSGMTAQEMQVACYNLAGQKGMKGLQAIINASDEDFQSLTSSIAASTGAAQDMADIKLDNYAGQVTLLKSAFDALKTTIGEQITPALGNLAGAATDAMNALNGYIQNNPEIVSAMSAVVVALGALTAALAVATVGATAFNAVMTAINDQPAILAVSAIVALTAGVAALIITSDEGVVSVRELTTATTELADSMNSSKTDIKDTADTTEAAAEAAKTYIGRLESLEKEYGDAAAEQDEYQTTCAVLLQIMPELSSSIKTTTDQYGKNTYAIEGTTAALYEQVEAIKQAAIAAALQESITEIYSLYADAVLETETNTIKLNEAQEKARTLESERAYIVQQLADMENQAAAEAENYYQATGQLGNATTYLTDEYYSLQGRLNELDGEMVENNNTIDALTTAIARGGDATATADDQISLYTQAYENLTGAILETTDAQNGITEEFPAITTDVESLAQTLIGLQDEYDELYQSAYDSMSKQFDLWEQASEVVVTSYNDMMAALESQKKYWEDYADNLENLRNRQIEGLDDLLEAYGEDASAVASMAQLSNEELQSMVDAWEETNTAVDRASQVYTDVVGGFSKATEEAIQQCVDTIYDLNQSDEARQAALATLQGYMDGLDEESDEVSDELKTVAQETIDKFSDALDIKYSSSGKFADLGKFTIQGYSDGISSNANSLKSKMGNLAASAIDAYAGIANSAALVASGSDTVTGYIKGATGKKAELDTAMTDLADSGVQAFSNGSSGTALVTAGEETVNGYITGATSRKTLLTSTMGDLPAAGINAFKAKASSSALTSSGTDLMDGFVSGVESKSSTVNSKMATAAQNAVNSYKENATSTSLYSSGQNTVQGFINGVDNKTGELYKKMTSVATQALNKFNNTLAIASPSKEMFSSGQFTVQGYVQGVDQSTYLAEDAMESLAKAAEDAFNPTLSYGDVEAAQLAYTQSTSAMSDDVGDTTISISIPVYVNGQYTREEITEIAIRGITRKQASSYASKGVTV